MIESTPNLPAPGDPQSQEREQIARTRLEAFLLTRLETDEAVEVNGEDFRRMREEFLRRRTGRGGM